jgi:methylglutaconyl-CoA hydratase
LGLIGETIDSSEALRIGLIHGQVPDATLDEFVTKKAQRLLGAAPEAIATFKQLTDQRPISDQEHAAVDELIDLLRQSAEVREGISAFREKRPPSWRH